MYYIIWYYIPSLSIAIDGRCVHLSEAIDNADYRYFTIPADIDTLDSSRHRALLKMYIMV